MSNLMAPRYKHDCNACVFIATVYEGGEFQDAYVCTGRDSSVVLRHGDDGPDYSSWPAAMVTEKRMTAPLNFSSDNTYAVCSRNLTYLWVLNEAKKRGHV